MLGLFLVSLLTAGASASAVARLLPSIMHCAGNYCLLTDSQGKRRQVVIGDLSQEDQRRLMLGCPVTRGCVVRLTAINDRFGVLQARAVLIFDV